MKSFKKNLSFLKSQDPKSRKQIFGCINPLILSIRYPLSFIMCVCMLTLMGCNDLPPELQKRKDGINSKLSELSSAGKQAKSKSECSRVIADYENLKKEVVNYTAECNKQGFKKNNDKAIKQIDESIVILKKKIKICYVCNKDLTNDPARIDPLANGNYYCTPCYRKTMREINQQLKYEGY